MTTHADCQPAGTQVVISGTSIPTAPSAGFDATGGGLAGAAGPGYTGEWALFVDYAAATDQPALPTTVAALTGFLAAVPAAPATTARRIRAIAGAHRRAGHLLEPPADPGTAGGGRRRPRFGPEQLITACPTRGWPHGFWGRRDAFLIVLVDVLGLRHHQLRALVPRDITLAAAPPPALEVNGAPIGIADDPRGCATCATVRWLDVLGVADGLGSGSARMELHLAPAPTADTPHQHTPTRPERWQRPATVLLPAIDRHGNHDHHRPMSSRSVRARLALAEQRAATGAEFTEATTGHTYRLPDRPPLPPESARAAATRDLAEVLTTLEELTDDADALNDRILALLDEPEPALRPTAPGGSR